MKFKENSFRHSTEIIALQFLLRSGHKVLSHNYKKNRTEIDLITMDVEATIHATEVKGWKYTTWKQPLRHPLEAITEQRAEAYRGALTYYVNEHANEILRMVPHLKHVFEIPLCFNLIWIPEKTSIYYYPKLF